ncbi:MAG TPA: PD-(D/E)XK nuclease family protein, partial [Acidimicrobiia bacterium]
VETPFTIGLASGIRVNGRIDAIYQEQGRWEVVDFKSGRRRDEPSRIVQLQAYAVAVDEFDFGFTKPEEVIVTFAYLGGGGEEVSHVANASWVDDARRSLESLATGIGGKQFTERTGEWCNGCDFLRFCGPGQERVG